MKKSTRLISLLLCIVMLLGCLPMTSLAANEEPLKRYTVLVLDTSGSVSFSHKGQTFYITDTSINYVKKAAKSFFSSLLKADGTNYVAVVSYKEFATLVSDFSTDINTLSAKIDKLTSTDSFRDISTGLAAADNLLSKIPSGENVQKNVVLFTTGITNAGKANLTGKYDENTVGSYWGRGDNGIKIYAYANHAISVAEKLKNQATVYTVGLFQTIENMPEQGKDVVALFKLIASDLATSESNFYQVDNPDNLDFTFDEVADAIVSPVSIDLSNIEQVENTASYATYKIHAMVKNTSTSKSITNVTAEYSADNSVFLNGSKIQTISTIKPLKTAEFVWTVQIDKKSYADGGVYQFVVGVGSDQTEDKLQAGTINLEAASDQSKQFSTKQTIKIGTGEAGQEYNLPDVVWEDNWFSEYATTYNHELARTALALSSAAYVGADNMKDIYTKFGFDKDNIHTNYTKASASNNDIVSYSFAAKKLTGKSAGSTLIVITVRGTLSDEEWYSNFNIGTNGIHAGFAEAYRKLWADLEAYMKSNGYSMDSVKFLVTGHSRGAAVANIAAAYLTKNTKNDQNNIFAYTFATPAIMPNIGEAGYENIFNIVNPEDFVTQVPLGEGMWGYKRAGIDLNLPSKSFYSSDYFDKLYRKMNDCYWDIRNKAYIPYIDGCQSVLRLSKKLYQLAQNPNEFYTKKYPVLYGAPKKYTCKEYFDVLADTILNGIHFDIISTVDNGAFTSITDFFVVNYTWRDRVFSAHSQSGYLAWMKSCTAKELFGPNNIMSCDTYKQLTVACPVDVYVYNKAGTLVASVVNEQIAADTLAVSVEDGVKIVDLPSDQEYRVEVKARETGTVDYIVEENSVGSGITTTRTVSFDDIAITKGDKLVGKITEEPAKQTYSLTKNNQTVIVPTTDSNSPSKLPFTDVTPSDWSYNDISYVWEKGLMKGTSDTTFAPRLTTSRAMIVTILYRLENEPTVNSPMSFDDVKSGQWYTEAIRWAQSTGIVNGYSDEKFGPNDSITREQMAAILCRYANHKGYNVSKRADLSRFTDAGKVSTWAAAPMAWANGNGLVNGVSSTTLVPQGNATREQVAAILHRFCETFTK